VVVKLEGIPDSSLGSMGGLCPKGLAGLQLLYDPNRLNVPLRRTNPEKGIGVDPKWQEISWDEALDEIATKLMKIRDEDPTKILIQAGLSPGPSNCMVWKTMMLMVLSSDKGRPLTSTGGTGTHCGNGSHTSHGLAHGTWAVFPDYSYCNYLLLFGTNVGFNGPQNSQRIAIDAVARGMKVVVFDPVCNSAAAKAAEWIPIIPGTDAAVCLAMLNVMVNELGIYDVVYLKNKTNAPYLIGTDGRYIRDKDTHKPMIWDTAAAKARIHDDPSVGDFALEGDYEVNGIKCCPSWQTLNKQFKKYTPEKAEEISSVPAATIRRIAKEFAEAASIGSTITIQGQQLPLRPVSTVSIRGGCGHQNSTHTAYAVDLLMQVVGAVDVPGGCIGASGDYSYPEEGSPLIQQGAEVDHDGFLAIAGKWPVPYKSYPHPAPRRPQQKDLRDLFLMEEDTPIYGVSDREEILRKAGLDPTIEAMLNYGCNSVLSTANPRDEAEFLRKVPFIVDFDLFPTEFNEGFADIVLPDASYFEYSDWVTIAGAFMAGTPLSNSWCMHICQKVIEPQYSRRYIMDVSSEILDRIGLRAKVNEYWNDYVGFGENSKLKPTDKYTWEELGDSVVKHWFGPEHDWEWFKKRGFISWPKKIEDVYCRHFKGGRSPIYREFMVDMGEGIEKIAKELDIEMDWKQYLPVPEWFPCHPHLVDDPRYDLYCFAYRDPLHTNACSMEQPWLDEASRMNPYTYNITMNTETAQQKGLKNGDTIELESDKGNKVQGMLHLRNGQHPQAVAVMGTAGHWTFGQPIARGKGINFNSLMTSRWSDCDPITLNLELTVKVRVTRVK
jgi:molybdopterin-containing oxidoreductase family molybdopterin binding subunit